jgi:hypothetical protein
VIDGRGLKVTASINSTGDGVSIREKLAAGETAGTQKIEVEEAGSAIAKGQQYVTGFLVFVQLRIARHGSVS